jgi:hypothetical protein
VQLNAALRSRRCNVSHILYLVVKLSSFSMDYTTAKPKRNYGNLLNFEFLQFPSLIDASNSINFHRDSFKLICVIASKSLECTFVEQIKEA